MRSPAIEVRTRARWRGIERRTDLVNGVASDAPSPVPGRDDGNIIVGGPDETLAGLREFCEHGCGEEGLGNTTRMAAWTDRLIKGVRICPGSV